MENKKNKISRRKFIQNTAAISSLPIIASCTGDSPSGINVQLKKDDKPEISNSSDTMPMRILGKSGIKVSVLGSGGVGGGDYAQKAMDLGVNLFDTASQYGTEVNFKSFVPQNRDKVVVSTKFNGYPGPEQSNPTRTLAQAKTEFANSLSNMGVDYIDIYLMHALKPSENVSNFDDIWKWMQDIKQQGKVRAIGFTSMNTPTVCKNFIERFEPDACILAMNATGYAAWPPPANLGAFVTETLPAARKYDCGVIAMKIVKGLVGITNTPEECFAFVLNQEGVDSTVVGMTTTQLTQNATICKKFVGETGIKHAHLFDFDDIQRRASVMAGHFTWHQPGYVDDGGCTLMGLNDRYYA